MPITRSILITFIMFCLVCCAAPENSSTKTPTLGPTLVVPVPTLQIKLKNEYPNIIFILADDMEADAITFMPKTKELIGSQGATFTNFYISLALCCPSRTSMLRGQYMHNTQISGNKLPEGGFDKFYQLGLEQSTMATWLQQAGYNTALFGKYLNEYPGMAGPTYVPPGWTEWYSPVAGNPYRNFNYTLNENGNPVVYGQEPEDYATDVISNKAQDFIQRNVKAGTPFFAFISVFAPHTPSAPAPRHAGLYTDLVLPRGPSFNEEDMTDKSQSYNELDLLSDKQIAKMEDLYRKRAQSLQAVDELTVAIFDQLQSLGQIENTYIIFTADNGYHMGQHRLLQGKNTPLEEDVLVPFLIRGPGITSNSIVNSLAGNIDLAPTFSEIAGVIPPDFVDGRSLLPLLSKETQTVPWRDAYLLERSGQDTEAFIIDSNITFNPQPGLLEPPDSDLSPKYTWTFASPYAGLRTKDYSYVEYEIGDIELYDMKNDPYQLNNIARTADPELMNMLHNWLLSLKDCRGQLCRLADRHP
jgi:N-acetylglucosamine-6-sulfatase